MAMTPRFKVYDSKGEYIASCKYLEDASALMTINGKLSTIREGHKKVIWTEGKEEVLASDTIDGAIKIMSSRIK